jgi:hypothetical protein
VKPLELVRANPVARGEAKQLKKDLSTGLCRIAYRVILGRNLNDVASDEVDADEATQR